MGKLYVINGKYLADRMQGLTRYVLELVKALDVIMEGSENIILVLPPNAENAPKLSKLRTEVIGKHTGLLWEQTDLRQYIKSRKNAICVNLGNVSPLFVQPGITAIHDVMYKINPSHYTTFKNRLSRYWHMFQYSYVTAHENVIITNTEFTRGEIEKYYPKAKGKIVLVPCGWQHVLEYNASADWNERYDFLKKNNYYFSLATLAKNKNLKWIIEAAKNNPNCVFAVAGKYYETDKFDIPKNVHMLGYISDEDACALIRNCKAFIHPSLYEGFGVPPLEALALGADVICSNTTAMPEVFGKSVHYIDPLDWNVNIDDLLIQPVEPRERVLEKFRWEKSAEFLLKIMAE